MPEWVSGKMGPGSQKGMVSVPAGTGGKATFVVRGSLRAKRYCFIAREIAAGKFRPKM